MPAMFDRCVEQVKRHGKVKNAYAVCRGSLGSDADIKKREKKKRKVKHG